MLAERVEEVARVVADRLEGRDVLDGRPRDRERGVEVLKRQQGGRVLEALQDFLAEVAQVVVEPNGARQDRGADFECDVDLG